MASFMQGDLNLSGKFFNCLWSRICDFSFDELVWEKVFHPTKRHWTKSQRLNFSNKNCQFRQNWILFIFFFLTNFNFKISTRSHWIQSIRYLISLLTNVTENSFKKSLMSCALFSYKRHVLYRKRLPSNRESFQVKTFSSASSKARHHLPLQFHIPSSLLWERSCWQYNKS